MSQKALTRLILLTTALALLGFCPTLQTEWLIHAIKKKKKKEKILRLKNSKIEHFFF